MKTNLQRLLSKKRVYAAIISCIIVISLIYWHELNTNKSTLNALTWTKTSMVFLFFGVLFMAMRDFAYMVRIRLLTKRKLSWKQAFEVIMIWEFASAISPGVVGGSAVAVFILEKENIPVAESTTLVITTLILDNLFYILIIPLVFSGLENQALFPSNMTWFTSTSLTLFWVAYFIIVLINVVLIISVFIQPKLIASLVNFIFRLPLLRKRKADGQHFAADIETASKNLKNNSSLFWLKLMGTTIWSWIARFLVLNMVLAAFITIGFGDHLLILARQLVMWLGMLVSPTPGGSGMAELGFTGFFQSYIDQIGASAIALALIWRSLSYYPYLLIGVLILPKWMARKST